MTLISHPTPPLLTPPNRQWRPWGKYVWNARRHDVNIPPHPTPPNPSSPHPTGSDDHGASTCETHLDMTLLSHPTPPHPTPPHKTREDKSIKIAKKLAVIYQPPANYLILLELATQENLCPGGSTTSLVFLRIGQMPLQRSLVERDALLCQQLRDSLSVLLVYELFLWCASAIECYWYMNWFVDSPIERDLLESKSGFRGIEHPDKGSQIDIP